MQKKVKNFNNTDFRKAPLFLNFGVFLLSALLLSACAAPRSNTPDYYAMECEELGAEIQKARDDIEAGQSNGEVNRTVDTGASVAVQGASIAGVPYVGAVFSIGKTLMNHNRQTVKQRAERANQDLYNLEDIFYEKGCYTAYE